MPRHVCSAPHPPHCSSLDHTPYLPSARPAWIAFEAEGPPAAPPASAPRHPPRRAPAVGPRHARAPLLLTRRPNSRGWRPAPPGTGRPAWCGEARCARRARRPSRPAAPLAGSRVSYARTPAPSPRAPAEAAAAPAPRTGNPRLHIWRATRAPSRDRASRRHAGRQRPTKSQPAPRDASTHVHAAQAGAHPRWQAPPRPARCLGAAPLPPPGSHAHRARPAHSTPVPTFLSARRAPEARPLRYPARASPPLRVSPRAPPHTSREPKARPLCHWPPTLGCQPPNVSTTQAQGNLSCPG